MLKAILRHYFFFIKHPNERGTTYMSIQSIELRSSFKNSFIQGAWVAQSVEQLSV